MFPFYYSIKIRTGVNPFLKQYDAYFNKPIKWRNEQRIKVKQITQSFEPELFGWCIEKTKNNL